MRPGAEPGAGPGAEPAADPALDRLADARAGRAVPGPAADPALDRLADAIIIPPFPGRRPPRWLLSALRTGLAGVTVFAPNISGTAQLAGLTSRLRSAAAQPVIAVDEEGGDVTRIAHELGSPYPGNAALGTVDDVALTEAVHASLGAELAGLGFNLNLAPAADVNTAADSPVIGTRSFGSDPDLVARHVAAAVTGLQSAGVAACAKHFPGHGSTSADSHDAIPVVDAPPGVLARRDLPPFAAAIAAGVRAIMPGHLRVPGLTGELPASLSPAALTGLLRRELGFTGVIVSDALEMRAVSEPYGVPEAAVLAVLAGTDLLCLGRDVDRQAYLAVRAALAAAVRNGRLQGERLEEAAERVAGLRAWAAEHAGTPLAAGRGATAVGAERVGAPSRAETAGTSSGAERVRVASGTDRVETERIGTAVGTERIGTAVGTESGGTSFAADPAGTPFADRPAGTPFAADQAGTPFRPDGAGHAVGLDAARRALRIDTAPPVLVQPLVVEVVPPPNIAAGNVPWGLGGWVDAASLRRISATAPASELAAAAAAVLAEASGRSLVVVVRDVHRYPAAAYLVSTLLAARPDAVVVEMGLPAWRPPAVHYVATHGAGRASGRAAAELLGLTGTNNVADGGA
jgi:beta-N-acetylhexosaminidase